MQRARIEVAPVTRGPFPVYREFPAAVQANENELAEVTPLIPGRVTRVAVDVGQDVKKEALLAMLHSAELGMAESAYLKAIAREYEADLFYARAVDLYEAKAVSLADVQRREAVMKTARAESREARNRLELLGVPSSEITRLAREQTIRPEVSIRAPFDGRVIMRNLTRGEIVEKGQRLFTVADLSNVWVVANVPEKDVRFVRQDQSVEVVAAAYPHGSFPGTITYVSDVLDPSTRTMKVRVTVRNPDRLLKPEMFALVRLYAGSKQDALTIPRVAVQDGSMVPMVFVKKDDRSFEPRRITVGDERGDMVTIVKGLEEGDLVVTRGAFLLKSEMEIDKVEPTP
ncbi:RND transporter [Nitrospira sp.]|nr:RND transporter [Nitrospira sp.]